MIRLVSLALTALVLVSCTMAQPPPIRQPEIMYLASPGRWKVVLPSGATLNTAGSTSQGLQEAINWATVNGVCLEAYGGPEVGNIDPNQITATQTISLPPAAKSCYRFRGVSLWCDVPAESDCIDIGAHDMLDFDFGGQIIYGGVGSAVRLYAGGVFQEGNSTFTVFTSSRIRILTIACVQADGSPGGPGAAIRITPTASFTFNYIETNEINGCGNPGYPIVDSGPGPVFGNTYNIRGVH